MWEIILKLILAIVLGGLIGLEREFSQKPAGLRTNILICVGSALMMIFSGIVLSQEGAKTADALRIAAGVITGIGFIGAGTIIQSRGIIHGLTTASTLWAVAGLGLVIGAGYYLIGIIFTGLVILTLILFRRIEESFFKRSIYHYCLKIKHKPEILADLRKLSSRHGIKLEDLNLKKEEEIFQVSFSFSSSAEKEKEFSKNLIRFGEITEIKVD